MKHTSRTQRPDAGRWLTVSLAALLLAACATEWDESEIEAVRDYIVASQLEEVDEIRYFRQLNYTYINDQFVLVPTTRGDYLVEFARLCRELRQLDFTAQMIDRRPDGDRIRARFDTIRGCQIGKIYSISDAQADELRALGDAPGDEIYIPEQEEQEEQEAAEGQ